MIGEIAKIRASNFPLQRTGCSRCSHGVRRTRTDHYEEDAVSGDHDVECAHSHRCRGSRSLRRERARPLMHLGTLALVLTLIAGPLGADAQPAEKIVRIGYLSLQREDGDR